MSVKKELSGTDRALKCAEYALDKKAYDVKVLDISKISSIADYLVIATGTSDKQVQAIADSVRTGLKKFGKPLDIEGMEEGKWIVIDYGDVLFHAFITDMRSYYDLDGLWEAALPVDIPAQFLWERTGA